MTESLYEEVLWTCSRCKKGKPESDFTPRRDGARRTVISWCKACARENYHATKHEPKKVEQAFHGRLKYVYGISLEQFLEMVARQSGQCAICGREPKKLYVDHSHGDGHVRGLLCNRCNVALPFVEDETLLAAARTYLRAWS